MKLYAVAIMVMKPDPELQYSGGQSLNFRAVGEDGAQGVVFRRHLFNIESEVEPI